MPQPIKIAVVGLGWVALHRHLPTMERNKAFEVVGVIDRSPGRAGEVARQRSYAFHAETDDLDSVEWLDRVEAVSIATSPFSHYRLIKQALLLGKSVLTEKPFTMTVEEGEELVAIAQKSRRQLAIVHNFQFARSMKRLQDELRSGRLGDTMSISAVQLGNPRRRLPVWYDDLPLGLFYDESPHLLYLLRSVAGPLRPGRTVVVPSRRGLNTPAQITAYFHRDDDAYPITLHCNFESPVSEWHVAVFGEHRLGIVDVFRDIYISLPNDGAHDTPRVLRTSLTVTLQHWRQHVTSGMPHLAGRLWYGNEEVVTRFARAIRGDPDSIEGIGPEDALAVLRMQHDLIRGHEQVYPSSARRRVAG